MEFLDTFKALSDVIMPLVVLPALWAFWHLKSQLGDMARMIAEHHDKMITRLHSVEKDVVRLETEQKLASTQRDTYHDEIVRRLSGIEQTLKEKVDKG